MVLSDITARSSSVLLSAFNMLRRLFPPPPFAGWPPRRISRCRWRLYADNLYSRLDMNWRLAVRAGLIILLLRVRAFLGQLVIHYLYNLITPQVPMKAIFRRRLLPIPFSPAKDE